MKDNLIPSIKLCALRLILAAALANLIVLTFLSSAQAQANQLSSVDRGVIELMLKETYDTVSKQYFDPTFNGVNLNASYQAAQQALRNARSVREGYQAVASFAESLKDSHTFFIPPQQPFVVEQGWEMQLIGDRCFVTRVKAGTDAAAQGLKPGDQITWVDNVIPSRENWLNLLYELNALSPRSSLHLTVVSPDSEPRNMVVASKIKPRRKEFDLTSNEYWQWIFQEQADLEKYDTRVATIGDVVIWKLPVFKLHEDAIDGEFHKAGKAKAMIFDLRGNPGGLVSTQLRMVGNLFDHDVKIGDTVGRDKTKPMTAKSRGDHAFSGKIIVLVDSESGSNSEVFARVMQLEKRGTVIGDRTAGAVREARDVPVIHGQATGHEYAYGISVTIADLKMTDGKSLEGLGVIPDELLLPTQKDLANGSDPQLARALQLAGISMSAEKAAKLFPPMDK